MGGIMDARDIVGILTPSTLFIFAVTFVVISKVQAKEYHSYNIGLGFLLLASGYVTAWTFYETAPRASLFYSAGINMISLIFFARGILLRVKLAVPYKFLGMLFAAGTSSVAIALGFFNSISLSFVCGSLVTSAQIGLISLQLMNKSNRSKIDAIIFSILVSIPIVLIGHLVINGLTTNELMQANNYQSSTEWITLNILVILLSTATALSFILFTLIEAMTELQLEADTDELTGLARKGRFESEAKRIFAQTKRTPLPVSLIVCDIDNFKQVNDKFGHLAGDKVLVQVSKLIKDSSRSTDIVGRIGGEEFAILLWNADINGARMVAEQLRGTLENHNFGALIDNQSCTASFGVAQLEEGECYKDLFAIADRALYRAKNSGRNRVNAATFVLEKAA